jgi:hypothetical protein
MSSRGIQEMAEEAAAGAGIACFQVASRAAADWQETKPAFNSVFGQRGALGGGGNNDAFIPEWNSKHDGLSFKFVEGMFPKNHAL